MKMMMKLTVLTTMAIATAPGALLAAGGDRSFVVTSSNAVNNELLVYDTNGQLLESVPTLGQGGVGGNAGGIATDRGIVAVVNFGSLTVSIFSRGDSGFELRQLVPTTSQPVSVAFGKDHIYVLGTTTVESHRFGPDGIDLAADGTTLLLAADGTAAQVGVAADQLIVTEKSGTIETVRLQDGAVAAAPEPVILPADSRDTPFGLVTRGTNAYVTIAHSDLVGLVKNGRLAALVATGTPGGAGQHSPCWIALAGPYLFTTNTPSRSITRLVAGGQTIALDVPVAAQTAGGPIDIAAAEGVLAVVESNGGGTSHLTQFSVDENGNLTQTSSTAIASDANGVVIVSGK